MILALMTMLAGQPEGVKPNCAGNTLEMNACEAEKLDRADKRLQKYLQAAIARHTDDDGKYDSVALVIQSSQTAFEAYREIECNAVLEDWKDGTIRTVMTLDCQLALTNQRTQTVWANWLQYMDSTPPILPKPIPIE
jgi:uncharacterized protein YecT (DUF1311 family)